MTGDRVRAVLQRVIRSPGVDQRPRLAVVEGLDTATFIRGLVAGALVGAALAGSTIWERRRARQRIRHELTEQAPPSQP